MKTKRTLTIIVLCLLALPFLGTTQNDQNIRIEILKENISGLIIGGYYDVEVFAGEPQVVIFADESIQNKINLDIRNGVLKISNRPLRQSKPVRIEIFSEYIQDYDLSGAVILTSNEVQKPEQLNINIEGAAQAKLNVETGDIRGNIKGAGILEIAGKAKSILVDASGASLVKIGGLEAENSEIMLKGTAEVVDNDSILDVEKNRRIVEKEIIVETEDGEKTTYGVTYDGSVARARFLGIEVEVNEHDETGEVRIGSHKWVFDGEGEISHKRIRRHKFNGHWGGVGLGINGYVNDKLVYELPKEYEFMNLLWQKSANVDLNIFEQNINLSPNKNFGLVTGIGYSIHNFRFTKSFTVMQDSNFFSGTYNRGINVRKSKIVTNYITVPLLFELQDKNPSPLTKHRWHVNIGAIFGVRVHAHQKTYFNETNKEFELVDPVSGEVVAFATSPSKNKVKVHEDFYLRPFKVDASLRVGWGWINLYANISMTEMFSKNKGPKLYPFSVGIMLVSW